MQKLYYIHELNNAFIDICMEISNNQFWIFSESEYQLYKNYLLFGI